MVGDPRWEILSPFGAAYESVLRRSRSWLENIWRVLGYKYLPLPRPSSQKRLRTLDMSNTTGATEW
jgi:hypothetical protein